MGWGVGMKTIIGVLLAGGQSRRFGGGDKCLRPLAGRPLLDHAATRLKPQASKLVLNANGDARRFFKFDLAVVPDPVAGFAGPLAGVLAGLRWAQSKGNARWIVTAATDSPFFPRDLATRLARSVGKRYPAIALAACGAQTHPTFGLWPTALADDLERALEAGTHKVLAWAQTHDLEFVDFEVIALGARTIDPFFNVNTPQDLAQAEALIAGECA